MLAQSSGSPTRLHSALDRARKALAAMRDPKTTKDGAVSTGDLQSGGGELAPDQSTVAEKPKTRNHQGIDLVIDRPAGYVQRGKSADGTPWERTYQTDYGYIPGTLGGDGEGLDVFIGPDENQPTAYWAIQQKDDGTFDEYKVLFGFESEQKARETYVDHIPEKFLKTMVSTSVQMCKALLGKEPVEVMKRLIAATFGERLERAEKVADEKAEGPPPAQAASIEPAAAAVAERKLDMKIARISVKKATEGETEQRFILGIVLEPDVVDSQGDTYSREEIRKTAHDWMERFQNLDLQHKVFINGLALPVESWIAPIDLPIGGQAVKEGTWMLGVHVIDDGIWNGVTSGAITGFSINGFAKRTPLTDAA